MDISIHKLEKLDKYCNVLSSPRHVTNSL